MFSLQDRINDFVSKLLDEKVEKAEKQKDLILLNKNENAFGSPLTRWYNRYYDSTNEKLRNAIAQIKHVSPENIVIGNGTAHIIDTILLSFCRPGISNVIICPPVSTIFSDRSARMAIEVRKAPLLPDFQLNLAHLESMVDQHTQIIWLCSPNNPTGNALSRNDVETILNNFDGLVVIDEAFVNYSRQKSFLIDLPDYNNLVVLQSMSFAWGLAGLKIAMGFSSEEIIQVLSFVKYPLAINAITEELALKALDEIGQVNDLTKETVQMRHALKDVLEKFPFIQRVYPSEANFLLVKMDNAERVYRWLLSKGIKVFNCTSLEFCENCLRITIGTEEEITLLVDALADWLVQSRS